MPLTSQQRTVLKMIVDLVRDFNEHANVDLERLESIFDPTTDATRQAIQCMALHAETVTGGSHTILPADERMFRELPAQPYLTVALCKIGTPMLDGAVDTPSHDMRIFCFGPATGGIWVERRPIDPRIIAERGMRVARSQQRFLCKLERNLYQLAVFHKAESVISALHEKYGTEVWTTQSDDRQAVMDLEQIATYCDILGTDLESLAARKFYEIVVPH